jgi:amidase
VAVCREALRVLEHCFGATIKYVPDYASRDKIIRMHLRERYLVLAGSFQKDIKNYLGALKTNPHGLKDLGDIIRLTKQDPREEYPMRGIDLLELAASVDTTSTEYQDVLCRNECLAWPGGIPGTLDTCDIDLIVAPTRHKSTINLAARAGLPLVVVLLGQYPQETQPRYFDDYGPALLDSAAGIP